MSVEVHASGEEIDVMWLCESVRVRLHIGRLYRFIPSPDCATCQAMKEEHDKAYGEYVEPSGPSNGSA